MVTAHERLAANEKHLPHVVPKRVLDGPTRVLRCRDEGELGYIGNAYIELRAKFANEPRVTELASIAVPVSERIRSETLTVACHLIASAVVIARTRKRASRTEPPKLAFLAAGGGVIVVPLIVVLAFANALSRALRKTDLQQLTARILRTPLTAVVVVVVLFAYARAVAHVPFLALAVAAADSANAGHDAEAFFSARIPKAPRRGAACGD